MPCFVYQFYLYLSIVLEIKFSEKSSHLATRMATRPAVYEQLSEFQPESETITAYIERAKIFLSASDNKEEKQATVFLSVIGGKISVTSWHQLCPRKSPWQTSLQHSRTILSPSQ